MSPIVFKHTDTHRGVQQDGVGPAATASGPLSDMLVTQGNKLWLHL